MVSALRAFRAHQCHDLRPHCPAAKLGSIGPCKPWLPAILCLDRGGRCNRQRPPFSRGSKNTLAAGRRGQNQYRPASWKIPIQNGPKHVAGLLKTIPGDQLGKPPHYLFAGQAPIRVKSKQTFHPFFCLPEG